MHPSLTSTNHRPWPLPGGNWTWRQKWRDLLFAHWPVPLDWLKELVPSEFKIQEFAGSAWLGVIPFRLVGLMRRPLPDLPWILSFPEVNVRVYVEYENKPGVWFLSLDASSEFVVWAARRYFHLPYHRAAITFLRSDDIFHFTSKRKWPGPPVEFVARYRPSSDVFLAQPNTLETFLMERYCLYAMGPDGACYRAEVHHEPWPLQHAEGEIDPYGVLGPHGLSVRQLSPVLHFSRGVDVVMWSLQRLTR